jgi:BirA family biotin operon repressor/biotin-[acetyl-CoA-carboxylase] ligase
MSIKRKMLALLSDGRIHSGAALGRALGVTRAAVHRQIGALAAAGVPLERLQGRGYRLREAISLLEGDRIRAHLDGRARELLCEIEVFESTDSTNDRLLERPDAKGAVCLAEHQAAGRGRRGNAWHASAFGNLLLSVGWRCESWPASMTALSLACAVAVARGLGRCGIAELGIKWPNDIVWRERKLAGILIEAAGESAGPCRLVVGVGVNVRMAATEARAIAQDWTDLRTLMGRTPDRNWLAGVLISEILAVFDQPAPDRDGQWRAEYERLDTLRGRRIAVRQNGAGGVFSGTALGTDGEGALLVNDGNGATRRFFSGEVSVRRQ